MILNDNKLTYLAILASIGLMVLANLDSAESCLDALNAIRLQNTRLKRLGSVTSDLRLNDVSNRIYTIMRLIERGRLAENQSIKTKLAPKLRTVLEEIQKLQSNTNTNTNTDTNPNPNPNPNPNTNTNTNQTNLKNALRALPDSAELVRS